VIIASLRATASHTRSARQGRGSRLRADPDVRAVRFELVIALIKLWNLIERIDRDEVAIALLASSQVDVSITGSETWPGARGCSNWKEVAMPS
jgi:hypothetical protein